MKLAILCTALVACANGIPTSQQSTLRPPPKPAAAPVKTQQFPTRKSAPALPTADALHTGWRGGDAISAGLELCVAPSGETSAVALRRSSGDELFDRAVVRDASRWSYQPFAADTSVCEPATVTYVP